jgi:hypothetical protein
VISELTQRRAEDGSSTLDEAVADAIKQKLMEADSYKRAINRNATSLSYRFTSLAGLQVLLLGELEAVNKLGRQALTVLEELSAACLNPEGPPEQLVAAARSCERCKGSEYAVKGVVCRHCRLNELWVKWEARLFSLRATALQAGGKVSADAAAERATAAANRKVGVGGLNERSEGAEAGLSGRRGEAGVAESQVVREASEAEQVLRMLVTHAQRAGIMR